MFEMGETDTMSTIAFNGALIHLADIYCYKGFIFEWHSYCGPMKCKKNGDGSNARCGDKFYAAADEWRKLPKAKREKYRWPLNRPLRARCRRSTICKPLTAERASGNSSQ
jgi:hypothetical protein